MNDFVSLVLTGVAAIDCIVNAVLAQKIFSRFRKSMAANAMTIAFILSAIAMCILFFSVVTRTHGFLVLETRQWISLVGFGFLLAGKISLTVSLLDFKRYL